MLSIAESGPIFKSIGICSSLFITPFVVNKKSGKLENFSRRKFQIWVFLYVLEILHYIHGLTQFVLLLTIRQDQIVLLHLPPQFDVIVAPILFQPVVFGTFCFYKDVVVKVFNELYDSNDENKARRPLRKLSPLELLALGLGIMVAGCLMFYSSMVILMNDMAHLLINNQYLKFLRSSAIAMVIAALIEMWSVAMWLLNLGLFLQLSSLMQSKMEYVGKTILKNLKEEDGYAVDETTLREALKGAVRGQLYIQLFNKVNSWFLETIKMVCIGGAILHGYVGMRFGHKNILIAIYGAFGHAVGFVAYCMVFQRAHRIGDMQKILKRELSTACRRRLRGSPRKEMLKAVKALQCKGMQVGSFHEMERNSAFIFMDFVERQLISLLVAF